MVLTKGPPAELDASPRKLAFLKIFGLTTLKKRDDLELAKCERRFSRHWERVGGCPPPVATSSPPAEPGKTNERDASAGPLLPYPPASPDSLVGTADFPARVRFLTTLDLECVPRAKREDLEVIWQAIVEERIRRNSINSVVLYCSGLIAENSGPISQTFMGPYLTRGTSRGNGCVDLRGKSRKRLRDGSFLTPKASLIRGYQLRNGSQSPSESMLSVSDATLINSKGYLHGGYNHQVSGLNHYHRVPHGHSYQQLIGGSSSAASSLHHHNSLLHSSQHHHPSYSHIPPTKVPKYPHLPLQVPISANPTVSLLHNGLKAGHDDVTKMAVKKEATEEDLDVDDDNEEDFEDEDEDDLAEEDEECEGVVMRGTKRVEGRFRGGRVASSAAKSFKWPGMEEVMEAYQRYSQERTMEREILGQQVRRLIVMLGERKAEADALERRLRELLAKRTLHDQQRHRTQAALDHLHACLRALR